MQQLLDDITELKTNILEAKSHFDATDIHAEIEKLEQESQKEGLWDNPQEAQNITQQLSHKQKMVEEFDQLSSDGEDIGHLCDMYLEEGAGTLSDKAVQELQSLYNTLHKKYKKLHTSLFLNGRYDHCNIFLNLNAGTGGTDAQDFTEMLLRMYMRYCEKNGYQVSLYEKMDGSEAGIKSASLEIKGPMAFGYLKGEKGVHRLIRQSPFNSKGLRQTSFAMVEVLPVLESSELPEVNPTDLRVETFRAKGAGGQHVNTTDSAVRITHEPTGIVVQCQNERSQHQNKEQAMKVLYAKLAEKQAEEDAKKQREIKGEHKDADFGNQIRTYTLHPYKLVKDHRTNLETANVEAVLDGDIELFIEGWLLKK